MAQRDYIALYINGKKHKVKGLEAFMPLANYLRYSKQLTGTKIVCAEGDCGACTVLCARQKNGDEKLTFRTINACISAVYLLDGCHIVTVEGLKDGDEFHAVQEAMVKNHGAQCGYCTPGFICALAQLNEDSQITGKPITEQKAKNYLTGNLCRCTGYKPIIQAACSLQPQKSRSLVYRFIDNQKVDDISQEILDSVLIEHEDGKIYIPTSLSHADDFINQHQDVRINSGGTDLGVLINKRKINLKQVVSLNNISSLYRLKETKDAFEIGCRVSLEDIEKALADSYPEFSRLIHIFASPQIKNTATLVGNVANGSPIGDTLPFLLVADARLVLRRHQEKRELNINEFYLGYKTFNRKTDEYIEKIIIPKNPDLIKLYKVSLRKDLDISAVTFAARVELDGTNIKKAYVALGGVGPTAKRSEELERLLTNKPWSRQLFESSHAVIDQAIKPLSDVRGSDQFRLQVCKNLMMKFYDDINKEHFNSHSEASI